MVVDVEYLPGTKHLTHTHVSLTRDDVCGPNHCVQVLVPSCNLSITVTLSSNYRYLYILMYKTHYNMCVTCAEFLDEILHESLIKINNIETKLQTTLLTCPHNMLLDRFDIFNFNSRFQSHFRRPALIR